MWDVGAIAAALSLLVVVALALAWAGTTVLTVVDAGRRARRRPGLPKAIRDAYPDDELDALEAAFTRILTEELHAGHV